MADATPEERAALGEKLLASMAQMWEELDATGWGADRARANYGRAAAGRDAAPGAG